MSICITKTQFILATDRVNLGKYNVNKHFIIKVIENCMNVNNLSEQA
jgi:hypothetical protein